MSSLRLIIFTAVELAGLALWLALLSEPGLQLIAAAVLIIGLNVEHFIAFSKSPASTGKIIGISLSEAAIWTVWLFVASKSALLGFSVLAGLMLFQHLVERNLFLGKPLFDVGDLFRVIDFTLIEVTGAAVWLVLVSVNKSVFGIAALGAALLVEHIIQTNKLKTLDLYEGTTEVLHL